MASLERPTALTRRSARVRHTSRLATGAYRSKQREFIAEGPQAVREALGSVDAVCEVFATAAATTRHGDVVAAATAAETVWHVVDDEVIAEICDTVHPQGMVARCRFVDVPLADLLARDLRLVVVCADIRDPGNAGTVMRCADAAGADAVIFGGASVDPFNPKAVRASVGSIFHVSITIEPEIGAVISGLQANGLKVVAADAHGAVGLYDPTMQERLKAPTAWLMGNEAHGLDQDTKALADEVVSVPIYGQAESLNLATAAALCLYASARVQRAD